MITGRTLLHIDPSIGSLNLGDEIIAEAVRHQLFSTFPGARVLTVSSRDYGRNAQNLTRSSDWAFLGGTNALSADPVFGYRQILTDKHAAFRMRAVVLLGVGWWQYQEKFGRLAHRFYRTLLRSDVLHSVRDAYTAQKLSNLGFENVLDTGCPTMWTLEDFQAPIPPGVVLTLTDYHPDEERDLQLIKRANEIFDDVVLWPQGQGDAAYMARLCAKAGIPQIPCLAPSVDAYDAALRQGRGFVGTRLHACIRALHHKRPAFLLAVDNRALEISRNDRLPIVSPDLQDLSIGADFSFAYTRRPTVTQFLDQFH